VPGKAERRVAFRRNSCQPSRSYVQPEVSRPRFHGGAGAFQDRLKISASRQCAEREAMIGRESRGNEGIGHRRVPPTQQEGSLQREGQALDDAPAPASMSSRRASTS
jgi:hypothetical protein